MNGSFFFLTLKRAFVRKTKTKNKMFKTLKKRIHAHYRLANKLKC